MLQKTEKLKQVEADLCEVRASLRNREEDLARAKAEVHDLQDEIDVLHDTEEGRQQERTGHTSVIGTLTAQLKDVTAQLHTAQQRHAELAHREEEGLRERAVLMERAALAETNAAAVGAQTYTQLEDLGQRVGLKDEELRLMAVKLSDALEEEELRAQEVRETQLKVENLQAVLDHFVSEREEDIQKATQSVAAQLEALHAKHDAAAKMLSKKGDEIDAVRAACNRELAQRNSMVSTLQGKLGHMRRCMEETIAKCDSEAMIEKKFVTKLFLQYVSKVKTRADLGEILNLMAGVLGWSEEEKVAGGAKRRPQEHNQSSGWLGMFTPRRAAPADEDEDGAAGRPSLSDQWVSFLLNETGGGGELDCSPPPPGERRASDPDASAGLLSMNETLGLNHTADDVSSSSPTSPLPVPVGASAATAAAAGTEGDAVSSVLRPEEPFRAAELPTLDFSQEIFTATAAAPPAAPPASQDAPSGGGAEASATGHPSSVTAALPQG